ncbi:nucleolar MIF4G domain-containing protein 1-like [Tropilaelaps mercedesae]|uniref:Nucleolar MIF4G domain-containing protein 1-like n=1 Tax=Tropilaelaps mercedesae TaxID=418985 RepID=A0A1V9XZC2_9ACAR|nr:nucleolar MIF4G domain-containing protein 1-like [Tropilaelaps mercedesae]
MKFRKGARKEHRQLQKQKRHTQSMRYLEWQRSGRSVANRIQKKKGSMNMRGINGQMNRIFTQLEIYERPQQKQELEGNSHRKIRPRDEEAGIESDNSDADLGDRLEHAYRDRYTKKNIEEKESPEDRIARLRQENEAEDREIAKLEKLLYLNKRKNNNMPKSFVEEGLDFIMELVDKKYKKKYNDDMELIEDHGELSNALTGIDAGEDHRGDDEDETSSGDELTQQNKRRRVVKFMDEQNDNEENAGTNDNIDIDDVEEENERSDDDFAVADKEFKKDIVADNPENGVNREYDEECSSNDDDNEETCVETNSRDSSRSDIHKEQALPKLKALREKEFGREKLKNSRNTSHIETKSTNVQGKSKKRTTESADDVMEKLKVMREAKVSLSTDKVKSSKLNSSKRTRIFEPVNIEEQTDNPDENDDFDEKEEEEADNAVESDEGNEGESKDSNLEEFDNGDQDSDEIKADDFIRKRNKVSEDGTYEDIYGRKRNAQGDVLDTYRQKYVPPAKRLAVGASDSNLKIELEKLKKQIKGQLNRLSESNLHPIGVQISELYSRHSKNNVTSMLSVAIDEAVFGLPLTPERLVLEPALLCALLHANEGHEVGAQILEDLVDRLKSLLEDDKQRSKGKQLENVLRFLCYLFLFKVVSHGIIYGVLNKLNPMTENDVELILAVLKTCGFALRKSDPLALKELISSLQTKCRDSTSSSRHRFMLDTLLALKNNNISKISNCDPSLSEKALKTLRNCLKKGAVLQELNVSLDDLYNARMKGKWWLVGSAWTNEKTEDKKDSNEPKTVSIGITDEFSTKIAALARKAGMNTDIRRSIFCIIMSAEDYLDASERLLRLNLTHLQQRELCYVLLLCARNEKRFNPYYAHLALFFCNKNKKVFSMTLQCAIWDAIKAIESYSESKISNLARFTALLVRRRGLPLAILRNVEFVDLSNDKVIQFLRVLLLDVLLSLKSEDVFLLFSKIALAGSKLELLKKGLGVFLKRFLLRNVELDSVKMEEVKRNIKAAEEGLSTQAEKIDESEYIYG